MLKAVLHVDEPIKWQLTLANTENLIADVGLENVTLEIIANAAAVKIFGSTESEAARVIEKMKALSNHNVKIIACRNALRANAISEDTLPSYITVVPAGITRIIKKQSEGYSYVKP